MDASEKTVQDHLKHRGYVDVVYEPDGKVPPDFVVDGKIAIEVRRLNQNHFAGPKPSGLEEVAIPLWNRIKVLIASMGPPTIGESWYVYFHFKRPIGDWKVLQAKLRTGLSNFISATKHSRAVIVDEENFRLEVIARTVKPHSTMFVMAGCSDEESGGWLIAEMKKNILFCDAEKSKKVASVRWKYPIWWLALVDHIGFGLDDFDRELFRAQVSISHGWDKILIIDPGDHTRTIEL